MVKKPYQGSDKEQSGPPPTNDERQTPLRIPVRKEQLSNSSLTSSIIKEIKDTFQQMEQTFADSLAKFCESQQRTVATELSNLVQSMKNTVNSDKPQQYDPKSENKIKSLQETITKQNDEICTIRNKLQTLKLEAQARKNQHQLEIDSYDHKLKKQKSDSDLEFHTPESNHKIQMSDLQRKLEMETQLRKRFENDTKAQADKYCTQADQINQLMANIKQ